MIADFAKAHPTTITLMLVAILVASGYLRFRSSGAASAAGSSSFILAVVILCLVLSRLPMSGTAGLLVLIIALALGLAIIVQCYKKRQDAP